MIMAIKEALSDLKNLAIKDYLNRTLEINIDIT